MGRMVLAEMGKLVTGFAPATPSSSTPDYITLKDIGHVTIVILTDNAATVTPSAITLLQATDVSGTNEKALAMDEAYRNIDTAAGYALTKFTVTSNTFNLDNNDNDNQIHIIEIDADELDTNNDFDCLRLGIGDATNQVSGVTYIGTGIRYMEATTPSAIVD